MFKKILIANRGEIACRIARTCHRLGIAVAGVHSAADADAVHVREIGESIEIGGAAAADSYLRIDAVIAAAKRVRRRGDSSRLRLSGRERRLRARGRSGRAWFSSARPPRPSSGWATRRRPSAKPRRPTSRSSPAARRQRGCRRNRPHRSRSRASGDAEGRGRRRRQRHARRPDWTVLPAKSNPRCARQKTPSAMPG